MNPDAAGGGAGKGEGEEKEMNPDAAGGGAGKGEGEAKESVSTSSALAFPSFSLSSQNPNNVLSGTSKGLSTAAAGSVAATALVVGGPVLGSMIGYNRYGVVGGGVGLLVGTVGGALGGAVVAVACIFTGFWQLAIGAIRTPSAIIGTASGKDWDDAAQEWMYNDLAEDAKRTLPMSDDDFLSALKVTGSAAAIFNPHGDSPPMGVAANGRVATRKILLDRELYDILGVEPEATVAEIKKAYYIKARQSHPDRNQNDPQAHVKFQKVGEAYQILSDERMRMAYDTKGKEAVDSAPKLDAGALYAMIFGSEEFETLIGELQISTQLKGMIDGTNPPHDLLIFKQRKREIQCAVNLASKLDVYNGHEAEFLEKARAEAKELSESPLGGSLLDLIGEVYKDQARSELSYLDSLLVSAKQNGNAFMEFWSTVIVGAQAAFSALELSSLQAKADSKQKAEDDRNNVPQEEREARKKRTAGPFGGPPLGPGPSATEDEKKAYRDSTKNVTGHVFLLMWSVTKADVQQTLANVCTRVLHDHSISTDARAKRAQALLMLGQEFCKCGVPASEGIENFLNRMGNQSGMFGDSPPSQKPEDPPSPSPDPFSDLHPRWNSEDKILQCLNETDSLSIKEMKIRLEQLRGNAEGCIEKSDVKKRLRAACCKFLTVESLRKHVAHSAEEIDLMDADREMLVDMILQL